MNLHAEQLVLFCLFFQRLGTTCTSAQWPGSLRSLLCWNPDPSIPRGNFSVCSSFTRWLETPRTGWWSGSWWMMGQAPFVEWRKYTPFMVFIKWACIWRISSSFLEIYSKCLNTQLCIKANVHLNCFQSLCFAIHQRALDLALMERYWSGINLLTAWQENERVFSNFQTVHLH